MVNKKREIKVLLDRWMYLLIALDKYKDESLNRISHRLDITYSWANRLFKEMENRTWLVVRKKGRELEYVLTPEGKEVVEICKKMVLKIDGPEHYLLKKKETENLILKEREGKNHGE
jgi:DNA-binding MarR family transcriptional regulator